MMNGVALFLILTSLVSGSFWSPAPQENNNPNPNVIIKEGHQFVVVEYDQEGKDGNTKILISPKLHETDNSKEEEEEVSVKKFGPRELVCDAFGKCKHKIADVLGKVEDQAKEDVDKAKEVVDEGKSKLKDTYENVKKSNVLVTPKRAAEDVQRVVEGGASKLKEESKENVNWLGEMAEKVTDSTKDGGYKIKEKAKRAGGLASDSLKGGAHMAREMAENTSINGSLKDMLLHSGGINSMIGVVHLLGFSMAFGMSMWVTLASSYILEDALPKQQFGMLQSKLYPVYFKIQACSIWVVLIADIYGRRFMSDRWEVINVTNIIVSMLLSLLNLLYLEPRATQVMRQRVKLEKDAGRVRVTSRLTSRIADDAGKVPVTATTERQEEVQPETQAATEELRKLNRLSAYVNIMTLMSLTLHLVYLGQRLQVN